MKAPSYAHLLPMPLAPLLTCPAMMTASGPVYRAAVCIAVTYWLAGCRALPTDTYSLASMVRIPHNHLTPVRPALDATLAELLPELDRAHEIAAERKANRVHMAKVANAARNRNRPPKEIRPAIDLPTPRLQPVKAAKFAGTGRTDMQARADAIDRQQPVRPATTTPNVAGHMPLQIERRHNPRPVRQSGNGLLSDV